MRRLETALVALAVFTIATVGCARSKPALTSATGDAGTSAESVPLVAAHPPTPQELANAGPFSRTSSGLQYRVLQGAEGRKPRSTDRVRVHYHGWLDDGTVFDSSYHRGSPTSFRLDRVVPGWTEGLQYVSEGGKIELMIPPELGYGSQGGGDKIPPNSTLHFVVELLAVNP